MRNSSALWANRRVDIGVFARTNVVLLQFIETIFIWLWEGDWWWFALGFPVFTIISSRTWNMIVRWFIEFRFGNNSKSRCFSKIFVTFWVLNLVWSLIFVVFITSLLVFTPSIRWLIILNWFMAWSIWCRSLWIASFLFKILFKKSIWRFTKDHRRIFWLS